MKNQKRATIATALSAAILGTAVSGTAMAYDHGYNHHDRYEHGSNIYKDRNFGRIAQKLRTDLRRSGYYVMDIEAISSNRIAVYAKKNNQPYELKYTYPGLKHISTSKKQWSTVWKDRDRDHHNRYERDDIEDNIKSEARYPRIKQRAIRKMNNMGYRVDDIDIDERNGRGVFEIDAVQGNQDYEVILGYPNLNVIKLERD